MNPLWDGGTTFDFFDLVADANTVSVVDVASSTTFIAVPEALQLCSAGDVLREVAEGFFA